MGNIVCLIEAVYVICVVKFFESSCFEFVHFDRSSSGTKHNNSVIIRPSTVIFKS